MVIASPWHPSKTETTLDMDYLSLLVRPVQTQFCHVTLLLLLYVYVCEVDNNTDAFSYYYLCRRIIFGKGKYKMCIYMAKVSN